MSPENADASETFRQSLIEIVIESWRFSRMFARMLGKLDAGEASRYVSQLRYFQKKLGENLDASRTQIDQC